MKQAILLVNLGTPAAATPAAVRTYLAEFLSDYRVIDLPRWQWLPILYGFVLTTRPAKVAKAYQSIWTDEGSPLLSITKKQAEALQKRFEGELIVDFAMRYGNPSVREKIDNLQKQGIEEILVIPMYPQYSDTTTASIFDAVAMALQNRRNIPNIRWIKDWHDHDLYIKALAHSIKSNLKEKPELLVCSYHGIPKRYADEGDVYQQHCLKTTELLSKEFPDWEFKTVFQSRFGREEWLKPYADETLEALPKQGYKNIAIICPAFSADCLETLEEIAVENQEVFMENGGKSYQYIPALNFDEQHIDLLETIARNNLWQKQS